MKRRQCRWHDIVGLDGGDYGNRMWQMACCGVTFSSLWNFF